MKGLQRNVGVTEIYQKYKYFKKLVNSVLVH